MLSRVVPTTDSLLTQLRRSGPAAHCGHLPRYRAQSKTTWCNRAQFAVRPRPLDGRFNTLGRLEDPAALAQGITRIKAQTVEFKAFIDSERIIGLLRQIQARQAAGAHAAGLVEQAVAEIRAAK